MNKSKKFMIISIITLIIAIIASTVTYAWYEWSTTSEDETRIVTSIGVLRVIYDSGANITNANLKPTATKEEGIVKTITVKTNKESEYNTSFNLYLDIISLDDGLKDLSFKYALYKTGVTDAVAEGEFSQNSLDSNLVTCETNNTSHIVLVSEEVVTTEIQEYKLYIWIDGNMSNPDSMQGQNFSFKLHADGESKESTKVLSEHITNLYLNNKNAESVTNNSISYGYASIYDKDEDDNTSGGLMNDRLGNKDIGIDDGNVRYYGANPNNYIDIGDRDSDDNIIPWRIIGVFKNMILANGTEDTLVKVVRSESIGKIEWHDDGTINWYNDWHNATLQTYLNTGEYYTELSQNVKNKIVKVKWNLGGWNDHSIYPNQIYEYERGNKKCSTCTYDTIWEGNIALMYPSDYGYAADLSMCSMVLYEYNTDTTNCVDTDWLFNGVVQWLLTPYSSGNTRAWAVNSAGYVHRGYNVNDDYSVRPVLYLNSNLSIKSGDGSQNNPYQLMVS